MRKQRCARPDFQRFRAAWLAHRNVPRVAEELGISPDDAGHWMKVFRFEGLDLPRNIVRPKKKRQQEGRGDIESSTPPTAKAGDTQAILTSQEQAVWDVAFQRYISEGMSRPFAEASAEGDLSRWQKKQAQRDPLADAKDSILRDLASTDDETVEKAFQRLGALERLKRL